MNKAALSLSLAPCDSPFGDRRIPVRAIPASLATALDHFAHEAQPVVDRAAIIVVAQIGAVAQELVDQIAIGAVDLDPVEPRRDRVARGGGIIVEDPLDVVGAWRRAPRQFLLAVIGMRLVRRRASPRR